MIQVNNWDFAIGVFVDIFSARFRHHLFFILLATFILPVQSSAQDRERPVRVGVFQLHPIVFLDEADQPQGLYIDLIKKIAEHEGWQVIFVNGTWAEGLHAVRSGQIDLMPVTIKTPERDLYLDFCSESVMVVWGQVFVGQGFNIQNILDLDGQRVAIMKDDQNGRNFQNNARKFGINCEIIEVGSHHEVFSLVEAGQAAAGVAPNIFGYAHAHDYGLRQTPILFDPSSTTFAAPKHINSDLLAAIDRQIREWHQDDGSYYYQTLDRWFGPGEGARGVVPRWLGLSLVVIGVATLLLLILNRSLNYQVKARTRELRTSEAKIRAIFDQTFQLLGVLDVDGRLEEINNSALELVGAKPADVIGRFFWDGPWWNHDPEIQKEVMEGVRRARSGKVHYSETVHIDAEGNRHLIHYSIKPIFDEAGKVVLLIPEGHDVTEKERLESELRQSQKLEAIGTMAGGIAHDFNNILTAIIGYTEMAFLEAEGQPEIQNSLAEVARASERARELVQQIQTFSRRREAEKFVFEPATVVQEGVKLLRSSLPSTIDIKSDIRTGHQIMGDPTQIHQVVMNLGTNAYHAMEASGGTLGVALREVSFDQDEPMIDGRLPAGTYLLLEISDTGMGMDAAILNKIFEPYFTSKQAGKGTGLGLSVVHGIVKSAQGNIRVLSEPGQGSSFQIFLPLAPVEEFRAAADSEEPTFLMGTESLLFVDDEAALVDLAEKYFPTLGYTLRSFTDSELAWAFFENNPGHFDLVITDQTMPRLTGVEFAGRIRASDPKIPIIICTGFNAGIDRSILQELNITQLMHKPMLMESLAREVRMIFRHRNIGAP